MIANRLRESSQPTWQAELQNVVTDITELLARLDLTAADVPGLRPEQIQFKLKVPPSFIARMTPGDPRDPLLLQVLPVAEELRETPGYATDPLAENTVNPIPGLLHKYHSRVLLTTASRCTINCRYCFRRHFPYNENNPGTQGWQKAFAYIAAHPDISEVILSGGEPLLNSDQQLHFFMSQLADIAHVTTVRIHTRMPITIPQRLTADLCNILTGSRLKPIIVTHCNHPQEIDDSVSASLQTATKAGILLLNQSVLLQQVNDNSAALIALSQRLFAANTLPYYLHLLDKVQGTSHFYVSEATAKQLIWEMMTQLPGYLVPKLVQELPGQPCKTPIG